MPNPVADNIRTIADLERQMAQKATLSQRVGERISRFIANMTFVATHATVMLTWIVWNWMGPQALRFDPYPYGLLTFIVSLEGVLITIFVLMAQNRMSRQTDQRDQLNLQIDMLAEQEMTTVLKMLRRMSDQLGIAPASADEARAQKLEAETNVYELAEKLQQKPEPGGNEKGRSE